MVVMVARSPIVFLVGELVNVLTDQARERSMAWSLDEVTVDPRGENAHVSLLVDSYPGGWVRLDVTISGQWVTSRPARPGPFTDA